MHVFTSGPEEFGEPDPGLGFTDERRVSLGQLIGGIGDRLRYTYDFGEYADLWVMPIRRREMLQIAGSAVAKFGITRPVAGSLD